MFNRVTRNVGFMLLLAGSMPLNAAVPVTEVPPLPGSPAAIASAPVDAAPVIPVAPGLEAKGYLLADANSGVLLVDHNADERIEPASITKIMTAYVIEKALQQGTVKSTDQVSISEKAWRMGGSKMFVEVGKQVELSMLLKGLIIQSGNDAAVALAEHVAGSEAGLVTLMNAEAARLGMSGTHFANVTGWPDPDHYMTARDIYVMARAMINDFPEHYKMYREKAFTWNKITQDNRNRLLWLDESVDGMKTGHTESAGFCLVASAERDGMRLISVVLGTDSDRARTNQSKTLLNYGFRFFETRRIYGKDDVVTSAKVWKGDESEVELGLVDDWFITFPRGQYDRLNAKLDRQRIIEAPVNSGSELGSVSIVLNGELLGERPLIARQGVEEGGIFQRAIDSIKLLLE